MPDTFSMVEVIRMNGLEDFLMMGEWSIFTVVPEDVGTYEGSDGDYCGLCHGNWGRQG